MNKDKNQILLDHQDWDTITINKSTKLISKEKPPISKNRRLEKKVELGDLSHNKIPLELRKIIIQKRNSNKWTQKELANKVNLSQQIINDIESGKAIYNHIYINKIKKILNISKQL